MSRVEVTKETYEAVKKAAAKRGVSMAALVNKVLSTSLSDKDVPVVLSIPKETTKDADALRAWLSQRVDYLVAQLCQKGKKRAEVAGNN